jgi:hypothetical protein
MKSLALPCLTAILLAISPVARGGTIFGDFGPGNYYDAFSGWPVTGASAIGGFFESAGPFNVTGNFYLSQIDIALGWISGTNSAVVSLDSDNGGVPGSTLMSWDVSSLPGWGICCTVQTLLPSSPLLLTSG